MAVLTRGHDITLRISEDDVTDDEYSHELTRATHAIAVEFGDATFLWVSKANGDDRHGLQVWEMAGWAIQALQRHGYDIALRCAFCRDNGTVRSEPDDHDESCRVRRAMLEASTEQPVNDG